MKTRHNIYSGINFLNSFPSLFSSLFSPPSFSLSFFLSSFSPPHHFLSWPNPSTPPFSTIGGLHFFTMRRTTTPTTTTSSPTILLRLFSLFFPWFGHKFLHRPLPPLAVGHCMQSYQCIATIISSFLVHFHVGSETRSSR